MIQSQTDFVAMLGSAQRGGKCCTGYRANFVERMSAVIEDGEQLSEFGARKKKTSKNGESIGR